MKKAINLLSFIAICFVAVSCTSCKDNEKIAIEGNAIADSQSQITKLEDEILKLDGQINQLNGVDLPSAQSEKQAADDDWCTPGPFGSCPELERRRQTANGRLRQVQSKIVELGNKKLQAETKIKRLNETIVKHEKELKILEEKSLFK